MKITNPDEINQFLKDQANVPEDGLKLTQAQAIEVLDSRTRTLNRALLDKRYDLESFLTGKASSWQERVNADLKALKNRPVGCCEERARYFAKQECEKRQHSFAEGIRLLKHRVSVLEQRPRAMIESKDVADASCRKAVACVGLLAVFAALLGIANLLTMAGVL